MFSRPSRADRNWICAGLAEGASTEEIVALETASALDDYTWRVAGCVGEFWTKMCRAHLFPQARLDDGQLLNDGVRFGKGLQLVNILRDLPADLHKGRCYLPTEKLEAVKLLPETVLSPANEASFLPLFREYLDKAESHLAAGWHLHKHAAVRPISRAAGLRVADFDRDEDN